MAELRIAFLGCVMMSWCVSASVGVAQAGQASGTESATRARLSGALPRIPEARQALLLSPLAPLVGVLVAEVSDDVDAALSVSLRYHRTLVPHLALSIMPVLGVARVLSLKFGSAGVKVGARLSPTPAALVGWYATPLVLLGRIWASQGATSLTSAGLLGLGLEAGYAWRWELLMLEASGGLQYSGYFDHSAFDGSAIAGAGLKPLLNLSLGHAW